MDPLALLWGTVALRPYVFAFLAAHAGSSVRALAARRAEAHPGRAARAWEGETYSP